MTALIRDTPPLLRRGRSYDDPHRLLCGARQQVNCWQKPRYPTMPIIWQDPPIATNRCRLRNELLELAAQPERWAQIATYTNRATAASAAKRLTGGATCGVNMRYEAVTRTVDGVFVLYARAIPLAAAASLQAKARRTA